MAFADQMPFAQQIFPFGQQIFPVGQQIFPFGHQIWSQPFGLHHLVYIRSATGNTRYREFHTSTSDPISFVFGISDRMGSVGGTFPARATRNMHSVLS